MTESATLQKISRFETDVEEINLDLHSRVKPEYLEKLKQIDKQEFLTEEEFEKELAIYG